MLFDLSRFKPIFSREYGNPQDYYYFEHTKTINSDIVVKVQFSSNFLRNIEGLYGGKIAIYTRVNFAQDSGFLKLEKSLFINDFNLIYKPQGWNQIDKIGLHFYRQIDRSVTVKIWEYNL